MGRRQAAMEAALAGAMGTDVAHVTRSDAEDLTAAEIEQVNTDAAKQLEDDSDAEPGRVATAAELLGQLGEKDEEEAPAEEEAEEAELEEEPAEDDDENTEEVTTSEESEEDEEGESLLDYSERTELIAALARDGLPKRLIESLSEAELVSYAGKRRKSQNDVEGIKEDMLRYKEQALGGSDNSSTEEARQGEPDKPSDTEPDLSKLAEVLGDHEASTIADFIKQQIAAGVEEATAPLAQSVANQLEARQRTRLEGMVPDGQEDGWFEKVVEEAVEMGRGGSYKSLTGDARADKLFDAALRVVFPDIPSPSEQRQEKKRSAARRSGSMTRGTRRKAPKKLTGTELMSARALAATEGKSGEEIREELGDGA